jgi:hypothetical protein
LGYIWKAITKGGNTLLQMAGQITGGVAAVGTIAIIGASIATSATTNKITLEVLEDTIVIRSEIKSIDNLDTLTWVVEKEGESVYELIATKKMVLDLKDLGLDPGEYIVYIKIYEGKKGHGKYIPISNQVSVNLDSIVATPQPEETNVVDEIIETPTPQESPTPNLVYIVPANYQTIVEKHYSWGADDTVEADFTCTTTYNASTNENERILNGVAETKCPAEYADHEDKWTYQVDRVTGETISSTCSNCVNIKPNPAYNGSTKMYAGFSVPVITKTLSIEQKQRPYKNDFVDGFWQWVGTETQTFDGVTGRLVETTWIHRDLFTGTYDGVQCTAKDFGYWSKGQYIITSTTWPLGLTSK